MAEFVNLYRRCGLDLFEALSNPQRRRVDGGILGLTGLSGQVSGGCTIFFEREVAIVLIRDYSNPVVVPYADVGSLQIGGRGSVTTQSGGGWMGGGFGVAGALEGAALAAVVNALTTTRSTAVETIVDFSWRRGRVVVLNQQIMPVRMADRFAPIIATITQLQRHQSTSGPEAPDLATRLTQLVALHKAGELTDAEFAAAKEVLLR